MKEIESIPNPGYGDLCYECCNQEDTHKGRAFPCREVIFPVVSRRDYRQQFSNDADIIFPTINPDKGCRSFKKR